MNIYLAGKYNQREKLQSYAYQLQAKGHQITSTWLNGDHEIQKGKSFYDQNSQFALEDLRDVKQSDLLIHFGGDTGRGGRHVELGIALGLDISVYHVGPKENVFHYLPNVIYFETWRECCNFL